MADLRNIIRQLAQPDADITPVICTVDAVNKSARTIDCTPIDESAPLLDVNLQAEQQATHGLCLFPKIGSFVVVGFVAHGAAAVLLLAAEIDSAEISVGSTSLSITPDGVSFNNGSLGGLVKVNELTARLNIIERDINTLKAALSSWVPVAQDGGAALKTAAASWAASQLSPTETSNIENQLVKH